MAEEEEVESDERRARVIDMITKARVKDTISPSDEWTTPLEEFEERLRERMKTMDSKDQEALLAYSLDELEYIKHQLAVKEKSIEENWKEAQQNSVGNKLCHIAKQFGQKCDDCYAKYEYTHDVSGVRIYYDQYGSLVKAYDNATNKLLYCAERKIYNKDRLESVLSLYTLSQIIVAQKETFRLKEKLKSLEE